MAKKIFIHLTTNNCYDFLKIKEPIIHCGKELWDEGVSFCVDNAPKEKYLYECDMFVFSGVPGANFTQELPKYKDKYLLWLMDDLMTDIPAWNPAHKNIGYSELECLRQCLERADCIGATTKPLREKLGYKEKTIVLPNLLDINKYPPFTPRKSFNKFLYSSGNTHFDDARLLEDCVKKRKDKQFIFFGTLPEGLCEYVRIPGQHALNLSPMYKNVGYVEIVNHNLYLNYMRNFNCDCGLAPLVDIPFNHCKSHLKWMEYSLLSMGTIASPVPTYYEIKHGETGILTNNWEEALDLMTPEIVENAHTEVKNNWTWQSPKREIWKNVFKRVLCL